MAASLVARGVAVTLGARPILDDVSVTVGPDTRVGVVGPNGSGKTTLLRVLAGQLRPDEGSVTTHPPDATVGYLAQMPEWWPGTVLELLATRTGIAAAGAELDAATAALAAYEPGADDRYSTALEQWLRLGAADFAARAAVALADVGLPEDMEHTSCSALSGGQMARVSLAAILLARFDVVLLDEPTNDLDFDGLERLERYVAEREGGVVVVSHDRAFLERTVTSVLEIDEHTHEVALFNGGWLAYLDAKATSRRHVEEAYGVYRTQRSELEARAGRQRQWAETGTRRAAKRPGDHDTAQRDFRINRTEKQAGKVRITEKALDRLDVVEKPWEGWELQFSIASAARSGDVVARLNGAVMQRGGFRLGPVALEVGWAERVAILGPNGSGKTTLLRALLGDIPLTEGTRWMGPGVVVGELDQVRSRFLAADSLLATFGAALRESVAAPGRGPVAPSTEECRSLLAKFGLGATHVDRPAVTLSPGERTRAVLALFMAREVNCLVLDEPTNHLDVPAIEQLEAALEAWEGTLLLVTHDRRLLESVTLDTTVQL